MNGIIYIWKFIYAYCTDFTINLANLIHLSYYEINALIFCVFWPMITVVLFIVFIIQNIRLNKITTNKKINKMKENQNLSYLKKIVLFLLWLLFSPLFFIFSSVWKYPKLIWRVIFSVFSPFTGILIIIILVLLQPKGMVVCDEPSKYTESILESKLDIDIPNYVEINHRKDYTERIHAELIDFTYTYDKRTKFFKALKRKVKEYPAYWSEDENNYIYTNSDFHFFIHKNEGTGRIGVQLNHPAPVIINLNN
jgi:hypothetical protein